MGELVALRERQGEVANDLEALDRTLDVLGYDGPPLAERHVRQYRLVIFARNPVHSVLWLIVAFFNAAGLMVLVGAEFIAMLLVIVYVGAVAVLFLFVVMMLDIDVAEVRAYC